jgi:hypothetical protein
MASKVQKGKTGFISDSPKLKRLCFKFSKTLLGLLQILNFKQKDWFFKRKEQ